jgi:glycosyltransferase involved in cell wall biosynthesis
MMKLLQIGSSWFSHQFSGLERYYMELVTRLPALGSEVVGIVYELQEAPEVQGLKLVSFGTQNKTIIRQFLDQRRIVKECLCDGFDLVVSHCTPSLFPSLRHLGRKPLISHFHGPRYLERILEGAHPISVQLSKYIEQRVYARSEHVITLSHYMKRVLGKIYGFREERISVVPGGVSLDQFKPHLSRPEARLQLNLPPHRPIILTLRRLERRMGLNNLIEAMAEVVRSHPDVLLLIAGKGRLQNELNAHIRSRNLTANIRMMGVVSDQVLPLLYRAADFSIVPSTAYEGFGLILVESLASGTPALGTPVGAIPEVLGPLSRSLLFEGVSPHHLCDGIRELLSGERAMPNTQACEDYAAANYAWPIVTRQIDEVYRKVLAGRKQGGEIG